MKPEAQKSPALVRPEDADRVIVVFSDVEMGAGGETDDFPHGDFLGELMLSFLDGPMADRAIDFIFCGDTFDLIKTPYMGGYPHHITKDVAVGKMTSVAAAHPKFFEAISAVLEHPGESKAVHFVVGNHDPELLFPKVQGFLRALCGSDRNVHFPGFETRLGPVHLEHGCQSDPLFRIDPQKPFIDAKGTQLLNLSWATIALLDIAIPLHPLLYFHDRLRPKHLLMEKIPEIRELLFAKAWRYWTKDFWREFMSMKDPLLRFNWTMLKEIVRRFTTGNPDVSMNTKWLKSTVEKGDCEVFVTGHLHQVGTTYQGSKRILQAGCFRDEYFITDEGAGFHPVLKPYYEIYIRNDQVIGIVWREVRGPDRPPGAYPASIYDIVPRVQALLEELGDRSRDRESQEQQEVAEAEEDPSG